MAVVTATSAAVQACVAREGHRFIYHFYYAQLHRSVYVGSYCEDLRQTVE